MSLINNDWMVFQSIGGFLGTSGGVNGTGIAAPKNTNIQQGVTPAQVAAANTNAVSSGSAQDALLATLQAQGGGDQQKEASARALGTSNNIGAVNGAGAQGQAISSQLGINAGLGAINGARVQSNAIGSGQALLNALGAQNGVGTQAGAISGLNNLAAQQQSTANQLQGIANGTGPNPAQAALNQATGQNVANQAALMAGQRGAGANVGLMARQAAQQGAATQQQAVGQGATMQAQQQIAGLAGLTTQQQAMGGTQQAIGGLGTTQVGQQAGLQAALASQGASVTGQQQAGTTALANQGAGVVGQQIAANHAVAEQANTVAGQEIAQTNANVAAKQAEQGIVQGALANANTAAVGSNNSVNAANAGIASSVIGGQKGVVGGLMNAAGSAMSMGGGGGGSPGGGGGGGGGSGGGATSSSSGGDTSGGTASGGDSGEGATRDAGTGSAADTGNSGGSSDGGLSASNTPYAVGGIVGHYDNGGIITPQPYVAGAVPAQSMGPQSSFGQFLKNMGSSIASPQGTTDDDKLQNGMSSFATGAGSRVKNYYNEGARGGMAHDFRGGGGVKANAPSEKAIKPGNSYANDKVKAVLSEGEVVLPRSVMQSKDPVQAAADFVSKVMAKRSKAS